MIEFGMVFALGALAATLLALSALPALDRRAQRLARRRLEALFPMSISEIAAERDHVRAAMAVEARRAEVKAEATARGKAADLAEIGRRDRTIYEFKQTLGEREASVAALESALAAANEQGAQTAARLGEAESRLAETDHVLASLRAAHQELGARSEADQGRLMESRQSLAATEEKLSQIERRLSETIEANAALQLELRAAIGLAAERQLAIATLDAQLETAQGDAREAARQLAAARDLLAQRETEKSEIATRPVERQDIPQIILVDASRTDAKTRQATTAKDDEKRPSAPTQIIMSDQDAALAPAPQITSRKERKSVRRQPRRAPRSARGQLPEAAE